MAAVHDDLSVMGKRQIELVGFHQLFGIVPVRAANLLAIWFTPNVDQRNGVWVGAFEFLSGDSLLGLRHTRPGVLSKLPRVELRSCMRPYVAARCANRKSFVSRGSSSRAHLQADR